MSGRQHGADGLPADVRWREAARLVSGAGRGPSIRRQLAANVAWIARSLRATAGTASGPEQPGAWSYADESRTERGTG